MSNERTDQEPEESSRQPSEEQRNEVGGGHTTFATRFTGAHEPTGRGDGTDQADQEPKIRP